MEMDFSTAHEKHGGGSPPNFVEAMAMLRGTLESTGELQINVQMNYVVLSALKALSDCGYKIHDGSKINLSRPVRKTSSTVLSVAHKDVIQQLIERLLKDNKNKVSWNGYVMALNRPDFDNYLVDELVAMVMTNHARAVDGNTFKTIADELAFMTSLTVGTVGTAKDWGLPANSNLTTLVIHVLDYYHNAWYRCVWRWFVSLFSPSKPGPVQYGEDNTEGK